MKCKGHVQDAPGVDLCCMPLRLRKILQGVCREIWDATLNCYCDKYNHRMTEKQVYALLWKAIADYSAKVIKYHKY